MASTDFTADVVGTGWRIGRRTPTSGIEWTSTAQVVSGGNAGVIGGTAALSDDSDATFARLVSQSGAGDNFAWASYSPPAVPAEVTAAYADGLPVAVAAAAFVRGAGVSVARGIASDIYTSAGAFQGTASFATYPTAATTFSQALAFSRYNYMLSNAGRVMVRSTEAPTSPAYATALAHEWRVRFTWTVTYPDATIPPACRLYPRDDVWGAGGASRLYPPPRLDRVFGRQP